MEGAHLEIGLAHLHQLLDAELVDRVPPDDGEIPMVPDGLATLKDWSREQANHISNAIKNRELPVITLLGIDLPYTSPINWSYTFLGFMESCGVYLRDWDMVLDAVQEHRQGNTETALEKLNDSVAEIRELAAVWGLDFKMLCDFLNDGPTFNGPFCGAFYSRNPSAPFVGVAFKGTTNWKDILVDGAYWTTKAADGIVHGTHVSRGPLDAMFKQRKRGQAFGLIHNGVSNVIDAMPNNTDGAVVTHVTASLSNFGPRLRAQLKLIYKQQGHSLGGSYSSICYTQFTESAGLPNGAAQGDMHTFGSPRVGESDFASILKQELGPTTGSSWRVVNKDDIVTRIPPPGPWAGAFNHLDRAYEISPTEVPVSLPSEIGQRPHGAFPVSGFENHRTKSYYAAMNVALNQ